MNSEEQITLNSVKNWLLKSRVLSGQFILNNWIFILPIIAIGAAGFLVAAYAKVFTSLNMWLHTNFQFREASAWGQLGDFIGGLLNPLISLFTLLIAALVWKLQKLELAETREAIKEQTFDQFFMGVLASHRAMSEQISVVSRGVKDTLISGKGAIDVLQSKLSNYKDIFREKIDRENLNHQNDSMRNPASTFVNDVRTGLQNNFQLFKFPTDIVMPELSYFCVNFYAKSIQITNDLGNRTNPVTLDYGSISFENKFGHVFRSTYQILKLIDQKFPEPRDTENKKKVRRYVNLLRAQMSESEFVFFALSALTKEGKKSWARSVRLDFFQGRLQNSDWTKSLSIVFEATPENIEEANQILKDD